MEMELNDFRRILLNSKTDVWGFIDAAITVASLDYGDELKVRRDKIAERLYLQSSSICRKCTTGVDQMRNGFRSSKVLTEIDRKNSPVQQNRGSPSTPESIHSQNGDDEEERDPYAAIFDDYEDEETKVLKIKEHLEDPDQSEDSIVSSLQSLTDMDITFNALKVTDIGRHVSALRKHPSSEVRRLSKQLVRKWKDLVDEWAKGNDGSDSNLIAYGDSPQQKAPPTNIQNGHHQVPDFAFSPNLGNGSSSGSDKNGSPFEPKAKLVSQPKQVQHKQQAATPPIRQQKVEEPSFDLDRLASARKRLQENYQEAHNAKKQRTIQVMDIHEIPKPKNAFFPKSRGGGPPGRHR